MEYLSLKKSLAEVKRDLLLHPFRTFLICTLIFAVYLLSIIFPRYIDTFFQVVQSDGNENTQTNVPMFPTSTTQMNVSGLTVVYLNEKGRNIQGEPYSTDGSYPVFGIEALDNKVKEIISSEVAVSKSGDSASQSHFSSSFEDPFISEKIISFEMRLYHDGNDPNFNQGRGTEKIIGINYDRARNTIYTIDDLPRLTGLSLNKLAQAVSENATKWAKENGADGSRVSLEPNIENFSNFIITEKEVVFIYQKYQIMAGYLGTPKIGIPRLSN